MLAYAAVILVTIISLVNSIPVIKNGEYVVPNDAAQCANDLIDWCQGMSYPKQGAGLSMMSVAIPEPSGTVKYFCASDYDGTNCTKNGSPWITCSSDNKFSYKEKMIKKDSSNDLDDDMCKAYDLAFNNLLIQNLVVANTTLNEEVQTGMEMMFKQLVMVKQQMEALREWINNLFHPGYDYDDLLSPEDIISPLRKK